MYCECLKQPKLEAKLYEDLFGVEVWIHIQPRSTEWTNLLEQVCDDDTVKYVVSNDNQREYSLKLQHCW